MGAGGTATVQIGYERENWALAAIWSRIQNGDEILVYSTDFTGASFARPGSTDAFAISGGWGSTPVVTTTTTT